MSAVLLAMVLLVDPSARRADVSGGVAAELRGGVAPIVPLQPSEPMVLLIVRPNVDLRIRDRRRSEFNLGIAPRMLLRYPNQLDVRRPIFLATAYMNYTVAMTRRWSFTARASSTFGEIDYTSAGLAFGAQQGAVPSRDLTKYASVEGGIAFRGRLARRHSVVIAPEAAYSTPFGGSTEPVTVNGVSFQPLPRFVSGGVAVGHIYDASPLDRIETTVHPSFVQFQPGPTFVNAEGTVEWDRRIRRALRSELEAGVLTAQIVDDGGRTTARSRTMPVGRAGLFGMIYGGADVEIDASVSARYFGFFDQIRAQMLPRVGGDVDVSAHFRGEWTVAVRLTGFTAATLEPVPNPAAMGMDSGFTLDETVFTLHVPATWRIDEANTFELGFLGTARGPHPAADPFELRNFEAWGYVAYRFAMGTAPGRREVQERTGSISTGATRTGAGTVPEGEQYGRRASHGQGRRGPPTIERDVRDESTTTTRRRTRRTQDDEAATDEATTPTTTTTTTTTPTTTPTTEPDAETTTPETDTTVPERADTPVESPTPSDTTAPPREDPDAADTSG